MNPNQAAWIRTHVLPSKPLAACACQYGPSNQCTAGDCDNCAHRTQPEWYAAGVPETWLTRHPGGTVVANHKVWLADRTCAWACRCTCHRPDTAHDRGLLFDLAAAA